MHRFAGYLFGSLLALSFPAQLAAQVERVRVRVTGYAQLQFNATSVDEADVVRPEELIGDPPFSTFETRRIRPTVDVVIDDWITGRIQPDFALGRLRLADAYMDLGFDEAFGLRVGQFKKPFSLLFLRSSSQILPIERGVRIRGLEDALLARSATAPHPFTVFDGALILGEEQQMLEALGHTVRELGVAAHGSLHRLGYEAGIFNGSGPDRRDDNGGKSFAGRITYRVFEGSPLVLGAGASYREARLAGDDADGGAVFGVDVEWGEFRGRGLHVMAEAVTGENFVADGPLWGAQGIVAYFQPLGGGRVEGLEPIARVSFGDPNLDREDDTGWLLTPGLNLYFYGRNRLMFNWDVFIPGSDRFEVASAFRAQAQLAF